MGWFLLQKTTPNEGLLQHIATHYAHCSFAKRPVKSYHIHRSRTHTPTRHMKHQKWRRTGMSNKQNKIEPRARHETHYNTLHHTATHNNKLKHITETQQIKTHLNTHEPRNFLSADWLQHTILRCNTMQHPATHCNTLQNTAIHLQHTYYGKEYTASLFKCNILQHTATTSQSSAVKRRDEGILHCNTRRNFPISIYAYKFYDASIMNQEISRFIHTHLWCIQQMQLNFVLQPGLQCRLNEPYFFGLFCE